MSADNPKRVTVRELAHSRSGDKGNTSNIAVIVYHRAAYALLAEQLTADRVRAHFEGVIEGEVVRYDVPGLGVFNFVCEGALGGGVSRSLRLDNYGKTLASGVLPIEIELPEDFDTGLLRGR
ncbi:AtuA-related protein [Salinisphaera aquimarina]|uniref:AtuA-like ferredoxin-fold domain-containing protein n=1 Tax=Salinisphaera aquimarina TaxID=2094031 RepID=A0ABV7EPB8_9GAMM